MYVISHSAKGPLKVCDRSSDVCAVLNVRSLRYEWAEIIREKEFTLIIIFMGIRVKCL